MKLLELIKHDSCSDCVARLTKGIEAATAAGEAMGKTQIMITF